MNFKKEAEEEESINALRIKDCQLHPRPEESYFFLEAEDWKIPSQRKKHEV